MILTTNASREAVHARLVAAVLPARSALSLKPVRIADWLRQCEGKSFVGTVDAERFKLGLLGTPGARFRRRGNAAIVVGTIEDGAVHVRLRPPIFNIVFAAAFGLFVSTTFVLSFYGPSNTMPVHGLLAVMLVLPLAILFRVFVSEARSAEQTLRRVLGVDGARD
ncbi:hypothetical protein [Solimonas terrae]|uniref:Uncharacterized protein n=1 Tax=Solimonas terrae TaxID=1396819 RepID=A0A6M2BWJ9_9GAMM|nr:hypothetical protein [Solimonas terrae]NGY06878.1 hypothetical protein [Solimonas terrae]